MEGENYSLQTVPKPHDFLKQTQLTILKVFLSQLLSHSAQVATLKGISVIIPLQAHLPEHVWLLKLTCLFKMCRACVTNGQSTLHIILWSQPFQATVLYTILIKQKLSAFCIFSMKLSALCTFCSHFYRVQGAVSSGLRSCSLQVMYLPAEVHLQ